MKRNEFLKQVMRTLVARRDALRTTLAGDAAVLRAGQDAGVGDEIDAALASEQAEMRSQMASYESRELAQIDAALERIKAGSYGRCDNCGDPIASLRLKTLPYASECIGCARGAERRSARSVNRIAGYDIVPGPARDESLEEIG
ncbi:MAG TPA: TraR/DksA family transcriptional regulator [Pirellulaceae bacterium]|nr:TraR/DksA family transcriptional regulator [Pirellulaceae bacterium]